MSNSKNVSRTRKGCFGVYFTTRTIRTFRIERSHKGPDGLHDGHSWHLFQEHDRGEDYCQTFATKREAIDAAEWIDAENA